MGQWLKRAGGILVQVSLIWNRGIALRQVHESTKRGRHDSIESSAQGRDCKRALEAQRARFERARTCRTRARHLQHGIARRMQRYTALLPRNAPAATHTTSQTCGAIAFPNLECSLERKGGRSCANNCRLAPALIHYSHTLPLTSCNIGKLRLLILRK